MNKELGKHYDYSFKGVKLDPYRIISVYKITEPEHQHAIKKLLRAGKSLKDLEQDIDEVILTLQRWKERMGEDQEVLASFIEENAAEVLLTKSRLAFETSALSW